MNKIVLLTTLTAAILSAQTGEKLFNNYCAHCHTALLGINESGEKITKIYKAPYYAKNVVKKFTFLSSLLFIFFLNACSDNSTVIKYDTSLKQLPCIRLIVFPPDKLITNTLMQLYKFDDKCKYELQVSKKSAIVCNSNQNADKKALSSFPSSYIRMDIYKNHKPIYSYYKDLTCKVSKNDIESAFKRLKSDLLKE